MKTRVNLKYFVTDCRCRTLFPFAVSCKIGALERNAYRFHVELIFIVIFGQNLNLFKVARVVNLKLVFTD